MARMLLAPDQRLAADEIVLFGFQRYREADPGLERIRLVGEFVMGEDQARLGGYSVGSAQTRNI